MLRPPNIVVLLGEVRAGRATLLTNCARGDGVDAVVERIAQEVLFDR